MIDMKQLRDNISRKLNHTPDTTAPVSSVKEVTSEHHTSPVTVVKETSQPMAIGATIHIKGDVTGDEDLIIHGHVEGKVNLKDYHVIIGPKGRVQANIHAKQVVIEGQLNGDIRGEEKVIIRKTGNVLGNVISPRVTLEDGAMFKGSIEMEPRALKTVEKNTANKMDSGAVKSSFV
jgi:cytoskeletal protein CcmA (bactofilin family)